MSPKSIPTVFANNNLQKNIQQGEHAIGLELFANTLSGFPATFKTLNSDFIVQEITETGEVCSLTELEPLVDRELERKEKAMLENTTVTKIIEEDDNDDDRGGGDANESSNVVVVKEEIFEEFNKISGSEEDVERLRAFLNTPGVRRGTQPLLQVLEDGGGDSGEGKIGILEPLVLAPSKDKEHRKQLHAFFRQFQLDTDSVTLDNGHPNATNGQNLCIRVHPSSGGGKKRGARDDDNKSKSNKRHKKATPDTRPKWPADLPTTLQFVMCKSGRDTTDALNQLGNLLKCNPKRFQIAGTKDKRAVTTQRISVYKYRAYRLASLNKACKDIKIGNFTYVERPLYFGKSMGNAFIICLRNIDERLKETVIAGINALRETGTINYFGAQRFGNVSSTTQDASETSTGTTHKIGALLLNGKFKEAVDVILQPKMKESTKIKQAKEKYLETKDAQEALRTIPRFMHIERAILEVQAAKGRENDFCGQLTAIPSKMKRMYINAYQSYLWNKVASERVRKFGINTVVEGDLVAIIDDEDNGKTAEEIQKHSDEAYDKGLKRGENLKKVKLVTAEDVSKNAFDPSDVVLPVPGHAVIYPSWAVTKADGEDDKTLDGKALFHELAMNKDGVDLELTKHSIMEFSMRSYPGDYRRLFLKPKDLECEFMRYDDPKIDLLKTDMDAFVKKKMKNTDKDDDGDKKVEKKGGKLLAAKLSFKLGAGNYATMILRELTKAQAREYSSHENGDK